MNEELAKQKIRDENLDDAHDLYGQMHESHTEHIMLEFLANQTVKSGWKIKLLMKDEQQAAFGGGRTEAEAIGFNKGLKAAMEVLGL